MSKTRLSQRSPVLELVQFTDPHLFADRGGEMRGVNTFASLQTVLSAARTRHWSPDALLVTGDIAQDESRQGYRVFREVFEPLGLPVLCLPGNHDNPEFMREELDGNFVVLGEVEFDTWRIAMLNTYTPGTAAGELTRKDLEQLNKWLATQGGSNCLVCLHHQPVPVGSRWLDSVGLRNPQALFEVLDTHQGVRGILWGHVHQAFDGERKGVRLMGTPSTCRQFLPGSDKFALDERPPGYRWLKLLTDGSIETGVEYVPV